MRRNALFWLGVGFLGFLVVVAVFGPWIRHGYLDKVATPHLAPSGDFWLYGRVSV